MTAFRLYERSELDGDGYPRAWHESIKHLVRAEAGNRCIRCFHPYRRGEHGNGEWSPCDERCRHNTPIRIRVDGGEWSILCSSPIGPEDYILGRVEVEAHWRILTVHHLDMNKANCRWWNLVALCQRCHLQIQGKVQMARVWPWDHTEWFRPYVAGYYAHVYLGQDLCREEAEARVDELLALERMA